MKWEETLSVLFWFILFFLNQALFFIFLILRVDSVHENGGRKKFGDEKYETEGYKILRKKRSERKQGFETLSSSSENEKKSTDSVSINFLLEILIFNLFF